MVGGVQALNIAAHSSAAHTKAASFELVQQLLLHIRLALGPEPWAVRPARKD